MAPESQYSQEQRKEAVIASCTRTGSAKEIAREYGVTREALYNWKNNLPGKEDNITMPEAEDKPLSDDKDALLSEIESLKRQISGLKLEKAILEGTAEIENKAGLTNKKCL